MPQSLYDAIPGRYCDFSMDREMRANFGYLSATCHLPDDLSAFRQSRQCQGITDVSTCSYRSPFGVEFLTLSQTRD